METTQTTVWAVSDWRCLAAGPRAWFRELEDAQFWGDSVLGHENAHIEPTERTVPLQHGARYETTGPDGMAYAEAAE